MFGIRPPRRDESGDQTASAPCPLARWATPAGSSLDAAIAAPAAAAAAASSALDLSFSSSASRPLTRSSNCLILSLEVSLSCVSCLTTFSFVALTLASVFSRSSSALSSIARRDLFSSLSLSSEDASCSLYELMSPLRSSRAPLAIVSLARRAETSSFLDHNSSLSTLISAWYFAVISDLVPVRFLTASFLSRSSLPTLSPTISRSASPPRLSSSSSPSSEAHLSSAASALTLYESRSAINPECS